MEAQSQSGYQIFNIDGLKVRIEYNKNNFKTSKIYRCQNIQLKNINIDTVRAGLNKTNQPIRVSFEQQQQKLIFHIMIQVPLLPTITQIIYCSFTEKIQQEYQNKLCLLNVGDKFVKTKELINSYKDKNNSKSISVICIDAISQNKYYDNGEEDYSDGDGILQITQLNIQQEGKYLITLSFIEKNLGEFYFYYGRNNNPIPIFLSNGEYLCGQKDPINYYCYMLRDTIYINNQTKNFRLFTYQSGYGTQYYNLVLTLEKLD